MRDFVISGMDAKVWITNWKCVTCKMKAMMRKMLIISHLDVATRLKKYFLQRRLSKNRCNLDSDDFF